MVTSASPPKRKRKRFRLLQRLASFAEWRGQYDLAYYFGRGSRAEPRLLGTIEIFSTVAAECEAIAYTIRPPRQVNQEQRINRFAPIIEMRFLEKYPQLEGRVEIVYKRSGGWNDPNGRYVPIFKDATTHGRMLESVLRQALRKDEIKVPRKSTTTLNEIAQEHAKIKKARDHANAARNDEHPLALERLCIIRFSSWDGLKKARKFKPQIVTGRVIDVGGVPTLYVVQSARERDITHNKSVRTALLTVNPAVVQLADVDRLGREYWEAAYNSFEAMGIGVKFKDPNWLPDMHLRRSTTKIDQQTKALDGVCVVHIKDIDRSKIRSKDVRDSLRRVRSHVLIKREKLALLGLHPMKLQQRGIGKFGNAFSEIVQTAIGSRQSFILVSRKSVPRTGRKALHSA